MSPFVTKRDLSEFIRTRRFSDLFIRLGWDKENLPSDPLLLGDNGNFSIKRVVEKRGFVVCVCDAGNNYPSTKTERRRMVNQLSRYHYEHLLIICGEGRQCWTVAIRPQNRPLHTVEVEWNESQDIQPLMEKLDGLIFDISEETMLGITDVVDRVRSVFMENAERITKRFYGEFKNELSAFAEFIKGIGEQVSKEWYAALMLNRLMFIYFIQKKRFLDGDVNYLGNRLTETKAKFGTNTFHDRFYRHFLRRLFSEGLGMPESARDPEIKKMLGTVPYLNGGLFDVHQIERENDHIEIPDRAFEKLFAFFNQYNWHLDSRPTASGRDINPDVIGYIFENYINNRAANGAYYTQEDVTGYIARNTIIPFLLNRTKEKCKNAFDPENGIWRFLREHPDNYICEVVKKGGNISDDEIPDNIRRGMHTEAPGLIERRKDWNTKTEDRFALPTEIWRETMARRKRYVELKTKIVNGEIHEIDDLITYNLDIQRFASDALRWYEGSDFIAAFYETIAGKQSLQSNHQEKQGITVLDPACGSGAFLFAALNILEPLYEMCIERMRDFVDEDDRLREQGKRKGTKNHPQFRAVMKDIAFHQNEKYWIYKTIILNNLYGVDLMKEAAEIAKLRLFLKLAAEAEYDQGKNNLGLAPLPDIDFNIRSGNSLVGFASMKQFEKAVSENVSGQILMDLSDGLVDEIQEDAEMVQQAGERFKASQNVGASDYRQEKIKLNECLNSLNDKMNHYLAKQHGKDEKKTDYAQWLESHQPFHWLAEFYGIVEENGGFDVVIGNPPYVKIASLKHINFSDMADFQCPDIYGYFLARAYMLATKTESRLGFIVMHNLAFHKKFQTTRNIIKNNSSNAWFSFYGRIPSGLFSGNAQEKVRVRNCIFISSRFGAAGDFYTTRLHRWQAKHRDILFPKIEYAKFNSSDVIPMFNDAVETDFFKILRATRFRIISQSKHSLFFKKSVYNWISVSLEAPPCFNAKGKAILQTEVARINLQNKETKKLALLLFNGRMFFAYWLIYGDEFHLTSNDLLSFCLPIEKFSTKDMKTLLKLADEIAGKLGSVVQFKLNAGKRVGSYNTSKLWYITDRSDQIFLKYMTDRSEEVFESIMRHVSQTVFTGKSGQG